MLEKRFGYVIASAVTILSAATAVDAAAVQKGSFLLQVRLASESPRADHDRMTQVLNGRTIYVSRTNIAADDGIAHVGATKVEGGLVLNVNLTPEGARRLAEGTRGQDGKLIVAILDSKVITAVPLQGPLTSALLLISADLSPELATALEAKVRAKWPITPMGSARIH